MKLGLIDRYIDFLGEPWNARLSTIAANVWRGVPFVAITLLAGLQTISPSLLRGLGHRRRHALAAVPPRHAAAAHADHRGGDDLLGAVHLHRLPADLRAHARRAAERHAPDGHAVVPARHLRRRAGRRRGDRDRDGAVPAGGDHVQLLRPAAARLAARGRQTDERERQPTINPAGMDYLDRRRASAGHRLPAAGACSCSCCCSRSTGWRSPRSSRTTNCCRARAIRSGSSARRWRTSRSCCSRPRIRNGCGTRVLVSVVSTFISLAAAVLAAYAIERLRFSGRAPGGPGDLPGLPGAAVDPVHPAGGDRVPARPVRHAAGADPHLPDLPDPVLHLAADGLLPLDPVRAGGVRADRRRHALADPGARSSCRWPCRA